MRKHYDMRMAVLIDADNADYNLINQILEAASQHGRITVKRIYADWTISFNSHWKNVVNQTALRPIQKFAYTRGKNSTDTALIIDAMDILHNEQVDGFCIVSSDSDYTGLIHRIREEGLFTMGIGASYTPEAFVSACQSFVFTENFTLNREEKHTWNKLESNESGPPSSITNGLRIVGHLDINKQKIVEQPVSIPFDSLQFDKAFEMCKNSITGHADINSIPNYLSKLIAGFSCKNFGFSSFTALCEAQQPRYKILIERTGKKMLIKAA